MFQGNRGQWLDDSPAIRKSIIQKLNDWNALCSSNPAPGIEKAIRNFYQPDRKISIYYLGDDFSDRSIRQVVRVVEKLNKSNSNNDRLVRIHAIGFPVRFQSSGTPSASAIKFANLMRELSYNNGGTFIGLNSLN